MPDEAVALPRPVPRVPALNLFLFLATVLTTLAAGGLPYALSHPPAAGWTGHGVAQIARTAATAGLPFAAAIIGILFCHEMGHYLLARAHGVSTTLPYFIPVPFGPIGTMGAVIRIRSQLPSRAATLDIGAAGPFAGFVVAVPLLAYGLAHSEVKPVGDVMLQTSRSGLFQVVSGWLSHAPTVVTGVESFGDSLVTWGVQRLVLGRLPPGTDVFLHPVAFAAWFGLFVTTLNLIPLGQLDGGHVTYALLGRRGARFASGLVSAALLLAGLFLSWNWLIWWAVTRFFVRLGHPPALDEAPLGPGRKALAWLALAVFAATFIPIPFSL